MNKLKKLPPAWHAEAIDLLKQNFNAIHAAFLDSTKKAVWLGIFLNEIKRRGKDDKSIPHGAFGDWIKNNFPELSWNQANTYMRLGKDVVEKGKIQIVDFQQFARAGWLPPEALKLIEGKTQSQLFLEFKQVGQDGSARRGRLRGGNSTARDPINIDIESFNMFTVDVNLFSDDADQTMPVIETPKLSSLVNSLKILTHRLEKILAGRKSP